VSNEYEPQKPGFCGFLNVLKPPGMSSAQVVGRVRRLLGGEKVGHAGTLDPEAAGVLPLMIGKAARLFDYLQDKEKAYIAEIAFGCATDTQDAQGQVTARDDAYPSEEALLAALPNYVGEQTQTPPMYSALKRDGKRLYQLARNGETVLLEARPVTVHALTLLGVTPRHGALITLRCSKGFYVRTLCHDLGQALGCPAHMRFLLRTQSGIFTLASAHSLEEIRQVAENGGLGSLLTPTEAAVSHLSAITVPKRLEKAFSNGVALETSEFAGYAFAQGEPVRLYLGKCLSAIGVCRDGAIYPHTWLGD
jgi:tRNA pseudouridine55 synthase